MYRKPPMLIVITAMLIAALACNAPTGPDPSAETATALFATISAGVTGTPVAGATTSTTQIANTPTNPPANSTATNTAAPQQCTVTAKTAVNVRNGPTTFHPILRVLAEGATGVVTGRNADTSWWQIDGNGWVSAPYVTTSGPCTGINVASFPAAPPTHTPTYTATYTPTATNTTTPTNTPTTTVTVAPVDFTVSYVSKWNCLTFVYATFAITNTGSSAIESISMTAEGPVGTQIGGGSQNKPFRGTATQTAPTCSQAGAENLAAAASAYAYLSLGTGGVDSGTAGKLTLTACSADDQGGTCITKSITFNW